MVSSCRLTAISGKALKKAGVMDPSVTDEGLIIGNQEVYGHEKENEEGKNSPQ